jgi:hypothetical protein
MFKGKDNISKPISTTMNTLETLASIIAILFASVLHFSFLQPMSTWNVRIPYQKLSHVIITLVNLDED